MQPPTIPQSSLPPVQFNRQVTINLDESLHERTRNELRVVFREPGLAEITATKLYFGYTKDFDNKIILGVEITYREGSTTRYATHIVKLGSEKKVGADAKGWQECTAQRLVASRIFTPVRGGRLDAGRFWVVYQDAFTLFGLDEVERQPQALEGVVRTTVNSDELDLLSAERAIAHVFTDLGRWFHPGAQSNAAQAWKFYCSQLRYGGPKPEDVLSRWHSVPDRGELRRAAVWVLAGRDEPDAPAGAARYLDPVEYVRWAMADESGSRLPDTLVGRGHGDLHGQNVLVGVRRGEVEYPAVFDYGEMSSQNVLVWDFAKLETELKVRLLPEIASDLAVRRLLLARSNLRTAPDVVATGPEGLADRLTTFLEFERLLAELTAKLTARRDVEPIRRTEVPPTGHFKLDRLISLLLRIRKEAALWLGFHVLRQKRWWDEYCFALAVGGLLNVRWHYEPEQQEAALVSAGTAVALMHSTPAVLRAALETQSCEDSHAEDVPSYRVPLARAHAHWRNKEYDAGCEVMEAVAIEVHHPEKNTAREFVVRPGAFHAVPLIAEAALLEVERGFHDAAGRLLDPLRKKAQEYRDFETLARIGRLFKDAGDENWENMKPHEAFQHSPAWRMYKKARVIYAEAYHATGDWYVGINVATLDFLTGDMNTARGVAAKVAAACAAQHDHQRKELYWIYATQGEAAVLQEHWPEAARFYTSAIDELGMGQLGMADSTYKQLCRLWRMRRDTELDRLLQLFEDRPTLQPFLSARYLGRPFPGV